jgi:hypothetical protein
MGFFVEAIAEIKTCRVRKNGFSTCCTHDFFYWSLENKLNLDIFNTLLINSKLKNGIMIVVLSLLQTNNFIYKKTNFVKAFKLFVRKIYGNSINMSYTIESFDIEEYANQAEYLKSKSARILNNVFRVSLSSLKKKHELVVNFEVIFDRFQVTYLRKRSKLNF